jgi:histidinol-phosphate phosphatase family protein
LNDAAAEGAPDPAATGPRLGVESMTWRRSSRDAWERSCYGARVSGRARALFLDWGGTLAVTRDNRTVVDADGDPVLAPGVAKVIARERPRVDACFIVSNQARISRGGISEVEVLRRFGWANERLGRPFTDWRLCPHGDEDGCACRKPKPGMFLDLGRAWDLDLGRSTHVGDSAKDRDAAIAAGIGTFVWARDFFGW